jgi:cytochrome b
VNNLQEAPAGQLSKILVWDIPARLFHIAFAASLTAAMSIGFLMDDEDPIFQLHMVFGIVAMFLLLIRIIMGVVGSRYSRFYNFPLRPSEIVRYVISAVASRTKHYAGNNPGSAAAVVMMFLLVPALFFSGIGNGGEDEGDLHGAFAWALLVVVVLHLAGLVWHTIRHRENISLAMVTGKKSGKIEDAISSGHAVWGVVITILGGAWIAALFFAHDPNSATVKVPVIGVTLQLGENESGEGMQGDDDDD